MPPCEECQKHSRITIPGTGNMSTETSWRPLYWRNICDSLCFVQENKEKFFFEAFCFLMQISVQIIVLQISVHPFKKGKKKDLTYCMLTIEGTISLLIQVMHALGRPPSWIAVHFVEFLRFLLQTYVSFWLFQTAVWGCLSQYSFYFSCYCAVEVKW